MGEIPQNQQDALLAILKEHESTLRSFKGVHYVDVGYRYQDGKRTDQLAIRVHVSEKRPDSELEPSQIIPREVGGVPVDVIQSNPQLEQVNRDARFNPLVGGVALRNMRHNFLGTLGVVVYDTRSGAPMALSNHHVLVANTGQVGDAIVQPASGNANDVIGMLTRWNIGLDCAVAMLNGSRQVSSGIVDYPKGLTRVVAPSIGMAVSKSGRTTETTFGIIDGVSFLEFTVVPDPANLPPTGEISSGGDSGSVWLEPSSLSSVGLHYAGETDPNPTAERAWAKRMSNVLAALNVGLSVTHVPVYAQAHGGSGIGGWDLQSTSDLAFAFDYEKTGRLDHLVLYRPGHGAIFILKNTVEAFTPVYAQPHGGNGIGTWDLQSPADRAFAFDYEHSSKTDHLVLYRPGHGAIFILKNTGGKFTPVYAQAHGGSGIGGWDLQSPLDQAFAFDYDHSGKLDHLVLFRPGHGAIFILKNTGGKFAPVYAQGHGGAGIGGWDLQSSVDRAFAFDYDHSGKLDHLVLYRPGHGAIFILKNTGGKFSPVYAQAHGGNGIGQWDLQSSADQAFAVDYDHSGKLDHLVLYRPGHGAIFILKNSGGKFTPIYAQAHGGSGIGQWDLQSSSDRALAFDYEHSGHLDYLVFYRAGHGAIFILRRVR
jgi:hypothetical protein